MSIRIGNIAPTKLPLGADAQASLVWVKGVDAKYVDWVRAQIEAYAPDASEPDRVQVLAMAAYNLSKGAGTLFGMHWPPSGLADIDQLRDEALAQLERWFAHLDEHDAVEVAKFIEKHNLHVKVPDSVAELLRRVESREGLELPAATADQIAEMARRIAAAPTPLKTSWLNVQAAAQATMLALQRRQWPHDPFMVEPPASAAHLAAVENELPFALPDSFVHVMGLWGRTAYFTWSAVPDPKVAPPDATAEIACGGLESGLWDLGRVLQLKAQCDIWQETAPDEEAGRLWQRALPFAGESGKYLALEVTGDHADAPVIFLSNDHAAAEGHGLRLAPSLTEFLLTWAQLGFPGDDIASLRPFVTPEGLRIDSANGRQWRAYLFGAYEHS